MSSENSIPLASAPQASATPFFATHPGFYISKIKAFHTFLSKRWEFLADVLGTFLLEPLGGLRAGYYMHKGLQSRNISALNPRVLTPEQQKHSPLLLIHGDCSKSGIWWPMIQQIARAIPHKPIFTIDLTSPSGHVKVDNHLQILVDKVKEIRNFYPSGAIPPISFVGHSAGAKIIPHLANALNQQGIETGALIKIGGPRRPEKIDKFPQLRDRILEIVGSKDIFAGDRSQLPRLNRAPTCHVSLVFHQQVKNWVVEELLAT